jgi:hypothetical protein
MVINHCDQWQNPLVNAYVRECVVQAGLESMKGMAEEAEAERAGSDMANFLKPVIRIQHGRTIHVLSLSPYLKPDSCTVHHITMMDCEDEGVLYMTDQGVSEVKASKITSVTPMKYYHCIGTRPNSRFNEQELNYIHSATLRYGEGAENREIDTQIIKRIKKYNKGPEQGEDVNERPVEEEGDEEPEEDVEGSEQESDKATLIVAKSFRISFSEWDVLVSSYILPMPGEDVTKVKTWTGSKTVISLFNYPPLGIRYVKRMDPESAPYRPRDNNNHDHRGGLRPTHRGYRLREPRAPPPDPSTHPFFIQWVTHGYGGLIQLDKVYVIDTGNCEWTTKMRGHFDRIRYEIFSAFRSDLWMSPAEGGSTKPFMYNLEHNESTVGNETMRAMYRRKWREVIWNFYNDDNNLGNLTYLYIPGDTSETTRTWSDIFGDGHYEDAQSYAKITHDKFKKEDAGKRTLMSQPPSARLQIAPRESKGAQQGILQQMRARIQSLEESKRVEAEHEGNKAHLLQEILQRLAGGGSSVKAPRYEREITADHGEQRGPARTSLAAFGSSGRVSGGSRRL